MRIAHGLASVSLIASVCLSASVRAEEKRPGASDAEVAQAIAAARPGDTIVLKAGVYKGGWTLKAGAPGKPITLKAERAGRVFVGRLSVFANLQPVQGFEYVCAGPCPDEPLTLTEADTGILMRYMATPMDLEELAGTYCYDAKEKRLCVHPSDSAGAAHHVYSAVNEGAGITLADYNTVDGLALAGFGQAAIWSQNKNGLTIENCVLHDNGYGIAINGGKDCVIRGNHVWNNNPSYEAGAQIYICGAPKVENILVENNVAHDCPGLTGIFFYGNLAVNCTVRGNLTYHNGAGFFYKVGGADRPNSLNGDHNVAVYNKSNDFGAPFGGFNTFDEEAIHKAHDTDLRLRAQADWKFADPAYWDFRLQSDSPARGAAPGSASGFAVAPPGSASGFAVAPPGSASGFAVAPPGPATAEPQAKPGGKDLGAMQYDGSVRYVRPDGDDAAEGASFASAWKTLAQAAKKLQPGWTLYIAPGEWKEPLVLAGIRAENGKPTVIRVHGKGKATFRSVAVEHCAFLTLEGLRVTGAPSNLFRAKSGVTVTESEGVKLLRCAVYGNGGAGVEIAASKETQIEDCALALNRRAGLEAKTGCAGLEVVDSVLLANAGPQISLAEGTEGFWSECNALAGDGKSPVGRIAGKDAADLDAWRALSGTDARSRVASAADFADANAGDFRPLSGTEASFMGRYAQSVGPDGVTPGKRIARQPIERVEVLSTTATSANVTFWTPGRIVGTCIEWGAAAGKYDARLDRSSFDAPGPNDGGSTEYETFHTVSLVGLTPKTTYHFRVGFCNFRAGADQKVNGKFPMVWSEDGTFATTADEPAPRALFVSLAGDDANDGLSPATAWRTVHKAAREARAGDTVTFAPGRYMELLRPLQTGISESRRITFRAEKPLTVFLDGGFIIFHRDGRSHDIQVYNKAFLTFENLACENCCALGNGGYRDGCGYAGLVSISGSAGIEFKNCVLDGRTRIMCGIWTFQAGLMPGVPDGVPAYTFTDSVFLYDWKAVGGQIVRPTVFLNNAFVREQIVTFEPFWSANMTIKFRNNIFGSQIFGKRGHGLFERDRDQQYDSDYNCFYWDPENNVKGVVLEPDGKTHLGLAEWKAKGQDTHSLEGDPAFPLSALMGFGHPNGDDAAGMNIPSSRPLRIEDLILPENSPCKGKGENGEDIGPRWSKFVKP